MALPTPQSLTRDGMTYDEIVSTLTAAGFDRLDARQFAAITTGRSDGDVVRAEPVAKRAPSVRQLAEV